MKPLSSVSLVVATVLCSQIAYARPSVPINLEGRASRFVPDYEKLVQLPCENVFASAICEIEQGIRDFSFKIMPVRAFDRDNRTFRNEIKADVTARFKLMSAEEVAITRQAAPLFRFEAGARFHQTEIIPTTASVLGFKARTSMALLCGDQILGGRLYQMSLPDPGDELKTEMNMYWPGVSLEDCNDVLSIEVRGVAQEFRLDELEVSVLKERPASH